MVISRILIDTNIYSNALRGDETVVEILRKYEELGISVVSIAELIYGFKSGSKYKDNISELNQFLDSPRVVVYPIKESTTEYYADILFKLKISGTPIPTNDIWIASTAFQYGLKLFTMDEHFKKVKGIFLI